MGVSLTVTQNLGTPSCFLFYKLFSQIDKQKYKKKQNQGTDSDVGETQTGTKIRNASDSNDETNEESYAGTVNCLFGGFD